jgi:hypothetical protein
MTEVLDVALGLVPTRKLASRFGGAPTTLAMWERGCVQAPLTAAVDVASHPGRRAGRAGRRAGGPRPRPAPTPPGPRDRGHVAERGRGAVGHLCGVPRQVRGRSAARAGPGPPPHGKGLPAPPPRAAATREARLVALPPGRRRQPADVFSGIRALRVVAGMTKVALGRPACSRTDPGPKAGSHECRRRELWRSNPGSW